MPSSLPAHGPVKSTCAGSNLTPFGLHSAPTAGFSLAAAAVGAADPAVVALRRADAEAGGVGENDGATLEPQLAAIPPATSTTSTPSPLPISTVPPCPGVVANRRTGPTAQNGRNGAWAASIASARLGSVLARRFPA